MASSPLASSADEAAKRALIRVRGIDARMANSGESEPERPASAFRPRIMGWMRQFFLR
jgi:hypothetical protein